MFSAAGAWYWDFVTLTGGVWPERAQVVAREEYISVERMWATTLAKAHNASDGLKHLEWANRLGPVVLNPLSRHQNTVRKVLEAPSTAAVAVRNFKP